MRDIRLTGTERRLDPDDLIVSKTDLAGRITYANRTFMAISGYTEVELLGKPHNLIRHPRMPRAVFKYLWDNIASGHEVFAYVVNCCKNGDHYWVFAHVTPTYDRAGRIVGYHSNRRAPLESAVRSIESLYDELLLAERACSNPRESWRAGLTELTRLLERERQSYEQLIFSISPIGATVESKEASGGRRGVVMGGTR